MDTGSGLVGVIVGALLAGGAQIIIEQIRRGEDQRGAACALAGEISALLEGVRIRGFVQHFEELATILRSGNHYPPPWFSLDSSVNSTPIMVAYVGRIGCLGGSVARRVAHFYNMHQSVLTEIKGFCEETNPQYGAVRIERTLPLWQQVSEEGERLVFDLLALSGEQPA
jgi:hypothetical protein